MTPLDISDQDLLRYVYSLGLGATFARLQQIEVRGWPLGWRHVQRRLDELTTAGYLRRHRGDHNDSWWWEPTPRGRRLAGLPNRPNLIDQQLAAAAPTPSGRRARPHVSPREQREEGWEVRPNARGSR
jgi:hypothetical protein